MRALTRAVGERALKSPWALIAGNVAVLAVASVAAAGAPAELGIGSTRLDDDAASLLVVLEGDEAADSRVLGVTRDVVVAQVEADPAVAGVEVQPAARSAQRLVLVVDTQDASSAERQEALERLEARIDPGPLRVLIGGETAVLTEARQDVGGDLWRLELLMLPFVFLVAALTLGPRLAPAALLSAAMGITATLAAMRALGLVLDVSLLGIAPAFVISAVVGLELPALLVQRYRAEPARSPPAMALRRALESSGGLIALACGLAAVPAFGLLVTGLDQAPSLILGCGLAAIFVAGSALISTAALIALYPPLRAGVERRRRVPEWLTASTLRAVGSLLVAVAAVAAVAVPSLDGVSRALVATDLSAGSEAALAAKLGDVTLAGGGSLLGDLPLAAIVATGLVAIVALAIARRPGFVLAALVTPLPAAAGIGASVFVFQQGNLAELFGAETTDGVQTAAVACAATAVAAVTAARTGLVLAAMHAERRQGTIPVPPAEQIGAMLLPGVLAATLVGVLVASALIGADLDAAKQFGLACAVGLLADLLLRVPLLAVLARL